MFQVAQKEVLNVPCMHLRGMPEELQGNRTLIKGKQAQWGETAVLESGCGSQRMTCFALHSSPLLYTCAHGDICTSVVLLGFWSCWFSEVCFSRFSLPGLEVNGSINLRMCEWLCYSSPSHLVLLPSSLSPLHHPDGTQGLMHGRQTVYHWPLPSALQVFFIA